MRVMKNKATLLSLAVAGLFAASAAQAQVVIGSGTGAPTYAAEIAVPFAVPAANAPSANYPIGFGVVQNQTLWIRYNLTNATFGGTVLNTALTDQTTATNLPAGQVVVSQGGGAGQNFVVFQITPPTTNGIPQGDVLLFTPNVPINMLSASGSSTAGTIAGAQIVYTLHGTAASSAPASNAPNSAVIVTSPTANYLTAATAYSFGYATAQTETIASINAFTKFCAGTVAGTPGSAGCAAAATDVDALIGVVNAFGVNVTTPRLDRTATAIPNNTIGLTVLTSANALTVTGSDLSQATAAYWDDATAAPAVCSGAGTTGSTGSILAGPPKVAASYTFGVNPLGVAVANTILRSLCVTVNGTAALTAQTFNSSMVPTSQTGYSVATVTNAGVGTWVRDGTELQSPWFTLGGTGSAYTSRFFLTNTGGSAVPCSVSFLSETGNTVTANNTPNAQGNSAAGVTIPANGQVSVLATDLVTSFSGNARAAVRFVCAGPTTNLQGTYVLTHSAGAVTTADMIRPGTN